MRQEEVFLSEIDLGKRYRSDDQLNLVDLVLSIKTFGIIQPITLLLKETVPGGVQNETDPDAPFLLLAGGRRVYSAIAAGLETIPAAIRDFHELRMTKEELQKADPDMVELRIRELEAEENLQREDLTDYDEIKLTREIHRLKQELYGDESHKKVATTLPGWSMADTAKLLKKSKMSISIDVALADAADEYPEVAEALKINKATAREVLKKKQRREDLEAAVKKVSTRVKSTPDKIRRKNLAEAYIKGDFFELIKDEPDGHYALVEMDPDWGIPLKESYEATNRGSVPFTTEEYQEIPLEEYEEKIGFALKECYRVMTAASWLVLWFGNKDMKEINERLLKSAGFKWDRSPCIWVKDLGAGFNRNPPFNLTNDYETFFICRKGPVNIIKRGHTNVFPYKRVAGQSKVHITEKPVELYDEIFNTLTLPNSRTLVCFAGSGNAMRAAANMGNPVKGIDLSEEFQKQHILRCFQDPTPYRSHEPGKSRLFGLSMEGVGI
ncbi:MAG: ParB N-terminal domain-containing protein [Deltaproteobacteria bacterium]|nr:ParB N-terminal domain-containing protein [Deltaproteobacteria bacterium]